jgi:hypothetical protein
MNTSERQFPPKLSINNPVFQEKIHRNIQGIRKLRVVSCDHKFNLLYLPGYLRLEAAVISSFNTTASLVNHIQIRMQSLYIT